MISNPYEMKLAAIRVEKAQLRVETLMMARKFIDDKLRSAKVSLKVAEEELIFGKQLRMFP